MLPWKCSKCCVMHPLARGCARGWWLHNESLGGKFLLQHHPLPLERVMRRWGDVVPITFIHCLCPLLLCVQTLPRGGMAFCCPWTFQRYAFLFCVVFRKRSIQKYSHFNVVCSVDIVMLYVSSTTVKCLLQIFESVASCDHFLGTKAVTGSKPSINT